MTTDTVLTIDFIADAMQAHDDDLLAFARAIEQAVLQSEQVQAWKKDAARYRWLRDEADGEGVCVVRIDYWSDEYIGQAHCDVYGGEFLDKEIDAAMEKKT